MQISAKVATQFATTVLTFLTGYLVIHLGLQGNPEVSALLPGLISTLTGLFAGWWVKEENSPPKPTPKLVGTDLPTVVSIEVKTAGYNPVSMPVNPVEVVKQ